MTECRMGGQCAAGLDPRRRDTCARCGRPLPPPATDIPGMVPRNHLLERELTALAARAGGFADGAVAESLSAFADHRALPGGIRPDLDAIREMSEEAADLRNYAVFRLSMIYDAYLAGDSAAGAEYAKIMRALAGLCAVWQALHS